MDASASPCWRPSLVGGSYGGGTPTDVAVARHAGPGPLALKEGVQFHEDFWRVIFERSVGCRDHSCPRLPINRSVVDPEFHTAVAHGDFFSIVFFLTPHTRPPDEGGFDLYLWC